MVIRLQATLQAMVRSSNSRRAFLLHSSLQLNNDRQKMIVR